MNDSVLDRILNTGLGIGTQFANNALGLTPKPTGPQKVPAAQSAQVNLKLVAIIGAAVVGLIVLLFALRK